MIWSWETFFITDKSLYYQLMIYKITLWCKLYLWRLCVLVHLTGWSIEGGFLLQDQCLLPTSGHNRLILEATYFAKSWFEGLRLDDVSDSYWYYVDIVFFWCQNHKEDSYFILLYQKMLWRVRNGRAKVTSQMRKKECKKILITWMLPWNCTGRRGDLKVL